MIRQRRKSISGAHSAPYLILIISLFYCIVFSFVDFMVIFNSIMLKFYLLFCLFVLNLICLLNFFIFVYMVIIM
jgi:hypothetical protein